MSMMDSEQLLSFILYHDTRPSVIRVCLLSSSASATATVNVISTTPVIINKWIIKKNEWGKIWNATSFVRRVSKMTASRSGIHHVDDTPLQIVFLTSFQVHSAASQAVNNQVNVSVRPHSFASIKTRHFFSLHSWPNSKLPLIYFIATFKWFHQRTTRSNLPPFFPLDGRFIEFIAAGRMVAEESYSNEMISTVNGRCQLALIQLRSRGIIDNSDIQLWTCTSLIDGKFIMWKKKIDNGRVPCSKMRQRVSLHWKLLRQVASRPRIMKDNNDEK